MKTTKKVHIEKAIEDIEENEKIFLKLKNKEDDGEELSYEEIKIKDKAKTNITFLVKQVNLVKTLPVSVITKLNKLSNNFSELKELFYYKPSNDLTGIQAIENDSTNKRIDYNENDVQALKISTNKIVDGMVIGETKKRLGIIDDLYYYTGIPTLKIERGEPSLIKKDSKILEQIQTRQKLYSTVINDEYSVSFEFRLNRFPSKTYGAKNEFVKQYTTRRTDLVKFNYDNENKIEFGAMAPKSKSVKINKQHTRKYSGKYSPFSIAANFLFNKQDFSIYTDYKFELGTVYNVTVNIKKSEPTSPISFGTLSNYKITLSVNNVVQEVATVKCKVWGDSSNRIKNQKTTDKDESLHQIASQPNFLKMDAPFNYLKYPNFSFRVPTTNVVDLETIFDFNNLKTIVTSPMELTQRLFEDKEALSYRSKYKINNGVDYGTFTIFGKVDSKIKKSYPVKLSFDCKIFTSGDTKIKTYYIDTPSFVDATKIWLDSDLSVRLTTKQDGSYLKNGEVVKINDQFGNGRVWASKDDKFYFNGENYLCEGFPYPIKLSFDCNQFTEDDNTIQTYYINSPSLLSATMIYMDNEMKTPFVSELAKVNVNDSLGNSRNWYSNRIENDFGFDKEIMTCAWEGPKKARAEETPTP